MPDTPTFTIKQGARRPYLTLQLLDDDGAAVDLTDASSAALITEAHGGGSATSRAMSFLDRDEGKVQYAWQSADTATAAVLDGEVDVTWASGEVETFPTAGTFLIVIESAVT